MFAEESVELTFMRRDDGLGGKHGEQCRAFGNAVQRIGIEHKRSVGILQQCFQSIDG